MPEDFTIREILFCLITACFQGFCQKLSQICPATLKNLWHETMKHMRVAHQQ